MQVTLAVITLGVGLLGLIFALLSPRFPPGTSEGEEPTSPLKAVAPVLLVYTVGIVVVVAFTLLHAPPFAYGGTLGEGIGIGGLMGVLASYIAATRASKESAAARVVGVMSVAILGPATILFLLGTAPSYPNEALMGCAIATVLLAALAHGIWLPMQTDKDGGLSGVTPAVITTLGIFALTAMVACTGARLAIEGFGQSYWFMPGLLIGVGVLVVAIFGGRLTRGPRSWVALGISVVVAVVVVLGAFLLQLRLLPGLSWRAPLWGTLAFAIPMVWMLAEASIYRWQQKYGLATAMPLAVLLAEESARKEENDMPSRPALAFTMALAAMALLAVGFKEEHGYGDMLAMVPALFIVGLPAIVFHRRDPRATGNGTLATSLGIGAATFVVLITLVRLLGVRLGIHTAVLLDYQQVYDLFSALIGAGAVFAILAFGAQSIAVAARAGEGPPRTAALRKLTMRTVILGALMAASPEVITVLWGGHAALSLLMGMGLGIIAWMLLAAWTTGTERAQVLTATPLYLVLGAALTAVQLVPLIAANDYSRVTRAVVVLAVVVVVVIWLIVDTISTLRRPSRPATTGGVS